MRTKVTLVLLFLNVVLFFFIFRFERRWRTEESWKETRRRVLGAETADIRTLELTTAGRTLALARRGDTWWLTAPYEWPANPRAVSSLINELQFLEHDASFGTADLAASKISLADYGLVTPRLLLQFTGAPDPLTGAAPAPTRLALGDETKDGKLLYLLSPDGARVHVVPQRLARALAVTFDDLRSDEVFTIPFFEARSLSVQTAAPAALRIRLRRDGARWAFEAPVIARASKDATELAINSLRSLHARSFVSANTSATLPSASPRLRVSLEGNSRRETLLVGDPLPNAQPSTPAAPPPASPREPEYFAQLEGRPALFTVAISDPLWKTLNTAHVTLRDTRVLDFDPRAVTAITLAAPLAPGAPEVTLQRLDAAAPAAAWQLVRRDGPTAPQTQAADSAAVARLLEQLSLLAATAFVNDAPSAAQIEEWGFTRPERRVTLTLAGVPAALVLNLGSDTARALYARTGPADNPAPAVSAVSAEILRELPAAPAAWRARLLRELPAGARLTAVKLTDLSTNTALLDVELDEAGHPKPAAPGESAGSQPKIENQKFLPALLTQLRTLRAREFVAEHFAEKYFTAGEDRAWRYRLDTAVALPGGAAGRVERHELLLLERTGGVWQFAGSREFDAIFAVEQPLLDALWLLVEGPRDPGPAEPKK